MLMTKDHLCRSEVTSASLSRDEFTSARDEWWPTSISCMRVIHHGHDQWDWIDGFIFPGLGRRRMPLVRRNQLLCTPSLHAGPGACQAHASVISIPRKLRESECAFEVILKTIQLNEQFMLDRKDFFLEKGNCLAFPFTKLVFVCSDRPSCGLNRSMGV